MKPEGSLPHSQALDTCPYPERDSFHATEFHLLEIHLYIDLPNVLFSSGLPTEIFCIYLLSHTCYAPHPSYSSWFNNLTDTWEGV